MLESVPTSQRCVMAVITSHPETHRLLYAAQRKARALQCSWVGLIIETPQDMRKGEDVHKRVQQNTLVIQQMGGNIRRVQAAGILQGIQKAYLILKEENLQLSTILLGREHYGVGAKWFFTPLIERLIPLLPNHIEIISVPLGVTTSTGMTITSFFKVNLLGFFYSILTVVAATFAIEIIDYFWPEAILSSGHRNKAVIYMIACAVAATRFGLVAGIIAAAASFFALNLFYLVPYYNLQLNRIEDATNLALFMVAAIVISLFGSQDYRLRYVLTQRAERLQSLLHLHRATLNQRNREEAIMTLDQELTGILGTPFIFYLASLMNPDTLEPYTSDSASLPTNAEAALALCWRDHKPAGAGTPHHPNISWRFEPLLSARGPLGVLAVQASKDNLNDPAFNRLLSGIADQAALIIDRLDISQAMENNRVDAEREKLRAMLLSSVSHDLKTPLASIIGSLSVYRSMGENLPVEHRLTLINTALEEAQRLDSFITNILDITRIESGQIEINQDWEKPDAILTNVLRTLKDRLQHHTIHINRPDRAEAIEVYVDTMLFTQVLQNVLDNAAKYTPTGSTITISWMVNDHGFTCRVHDNGPGIPTEQLSKVFDKYARIQRKDSQVAGTGLGLSIARYIMQAQSGSITASNHTEGGALFTLILPMWRYRTIQSKLANEV